MPKKRKGRPLNGWLTVNKPKGLTSTACVGWLKRLYGPQKIGHGGTLDPLADGILPIAMGEATKTVQWAMDAEKAYEFTIQWGESRATIDAEGAITGTSDARPDLADLERQLTEATGQHAQIPPQYSAVKIDGHRAYDLARDGTDFVIKPRSVFLRSADIIENTIDHTTLRIVTGKGYYVRALARDLAKAVDCHGYVSALTRTAVGPMSLSAAKTPEEIEELDDDARIALLQPIDLVLDALPKVEIGLQFVGDIRQGRAVIVRDGAPQTLEKCLAVSAGQQIALGTVQLGIFHPKKVFNL